MDGLQRPLNDSEKSIYQLSAPATNVSTLGTFGLRALSAETQNVFGPAVSNISRSGYQRLYIQANQPGYIAYSVVPATMSSGAAGYRARELEWRRTNVHTLERFAGQWVALEGEEIISHGSDPVAVAAEARRRGIITPYIFYVESRRSNVVQMGL
jgi:hypothetical protein